MHSLFQIILFFFLFQSIIPDPAAELVTSIPEYDYKGRLYSGYLDVSNVKKFHYMFNYAFEDPEHKPFVLWLNGGPGCSSLDGWANEHGPMQFLPDGKFHYNEYTWIKVANILYLESPGDVGFSYVDSKLDYELRINDDIAAEDNLHALLSFFKKFPSMKDKDFYISGESYGGIYVPTLANKVIEYNKNLPESKKIRLKGILVGNGVADWNYDTDPATIEFAFSHHLYSYETRLDYNKYCILNYDEEKCNNVRIKIDKDLEGINIYDYLRRCEVPKSNSNSKYYKYARWAFKNKKFDTTEEKTEKESNGAPCFDDSKLEAFMNRADVQSALHVEARRQWVVCSDEVGGRYEIQDKGSIWAYPNLIKEGIRILIYSGDTDAIVPYNGNQKWIENLKLEIEEPFRQWRVDNDPENVAGYIIKYKGLTFCTIKGTGHMVPQWKPKEAYYMFKQFINDEDF